MEYQATRPSVFGTALRGFGYTAFSGAAMAGIFIGVNLLFGGAITAAIAGWMGAGAIATGISTVAQVALSTGIFGAGIQTYSLIANRGREAAYQAAAFTPSNGRDIAITSVSQNLYSPKLQAALDRARSDQPTTSLDAAPETTQFRDRAGTQSSLNEILNGRLTRTDRSHTDRLTEQREAQAAASTRTLQ